MSNKVWWQSKTIWFNVLSGGLAVLNEVSGKLVPTEIATTVIAIGNVVLRFLTDKPVTVN